jgi:hypothetical protein
MYRDGCFPRRRLCNDTAPVIEKAALHEDNGTGIGIVRMGSSGHRTADRQKVVADRRIQQLNFPCDPQNCFLRRTGPEKEKDHELIIFVDMDFAQSERFQIGIDLPFAAAHLLLVAGCFQIGNMPFRKFDGNSRKRSVLGKGPSQIRTGPVDPFRIVALRPAEQRRQPGFPVSPAPGFFLQRLLCLRILGNRFMDRFFQFQQVQRFFHIPYGFVSYGSLQVFLVRIAAHENDRRVGHVFTDLLRHFHTAHLRHPNIRQNDLRLFPLRSSESLPAVLRFQYRIDLKILPVDRGSDTFSCQCFIVNDQDLYHVCRPCDSLDGKTVLQNTVPILPNRKEIEKPRTFLRTADRYGAASLRENQ